MKTRFVIPRFAAALCLFLGAAFLAFFSFAAAPPAGGAASQQARSNRVQAAAAAATEGLSRLQSSSTAQITAHRSNATGSYNFLRAARGGVMARDDASRPAQARALAFLASHGAVVGMNNAEREAVRTGTSPRAGAELKVARAHSDKLGMSHVRLDQVYNGLKVFGAQVVVHMDSNGITGVNGDFVRGLSMSTAPAVSREAAAEAALTVMRKTESAKNWQVNRPGELAIYPQGLLERSAVNAVLAYAIEFGSGHEAEQVWVDAQSGILLARIPLHHRAIHRTIYSPIYDSARPDLFVQRKEGDPPHPTPMVNNLYDFAGQTYNMYASGFGRLSYDGADHKMISVYLVNDQCQNAYWDGESTNYCPSYDTDDVVSHEWSHAYTEYTHGLIYAFQSGALNEAYSDMFGETVDLLNGADGLGGNKNDKPDPDGQRWVIGEDVADGAIRDMYDPTRFSDADKVSSPNYFCGTSDGGGVHSNSGVPNHAFALIVDGTQFKPADAAIGQAAGTFNGQTITGIGLEKAAAIYFRAQTVYQVPTTGFPEHDLAIQTSCSDLTGQPINKLSTTSTEVVVSANTITAADCAEVAKAMLAVEMSVEPPCAYGPVLDPNPPSICGGAATIFSEDWETDGEAGAAARGWTKTSQGGGIGTGAVDWEQQPSKNNTRFFKIVSDLRGGRTGSAAFAIDPAIGDEGGGTCKPSGDFSGYHTLDSPPITIPAGATAPQLMFDHYVATEFGVDGGQVEISKDNGATWSLLPQDQYVHNAPNVPFTGPPPLGNNTNPNPNEFAWTGFNLGTHILGSWGTTVVNLGSVAQPGNTIKLRWTWSQDGCNGVQGWYVDNIRVFNCPNLQGPTLATGSDYTNPDPDGTFTLNWTRPAAASGPDVLEVSQTSCAPLLADDAEGGTSQWTIATKGSTPTPMWKTSDTKPKPGHSSKTFYADPLTDGSETRNDETTLTYKNPIAIPSVGTTSLRFKEWYYNEDDDRGFVEVSTDDGANWTAIYTNSRDMGDLPDAGAQAFATERLVQQELDLTIYSGKNLRLRFRYAMGGSNFTFFTPLGWYIDDIVIANDSWTDVTKTDGTSFTDQKGSGSYCYRVRTNYVIGAETLTSLFSNIVSVTVAPGVPAPSRGVFQFGAASYAVGENGGTATITVTRSQGSTGEASVEYRTSDGSASAPGDYTATSGTLVFAANEASKDFQVQVADDGIAEGDETINLALGNPLGGATLGSPAGAVLKIIDNDTAGAGPGSLQFSAASYSEAENAGNATITVTRTGGSDGSVTVAFATTDGSATAGSDYTATSGTLTFGPGEVTKSFDVPLTDESTPEPDETVNLTLSDVTGGATLGSPSAATLTILDTDRPEAPPPPAQLLNISTRLRVQGGDKVGIGGIIITGDVPKRVLLRGIGPSLAIDGEPVAGRLQDPVIELYNGNGAFIASNDNWKDSPERAEIEASGLAPSDDAEATIARSVTPGAYTVMVFGQGESEGIALVEAYDRDQGGTAEMANISTRGFVDTGDNVLIGGFIAGGRSGTTSVIIRAMGPSLSSKGVPDALQNPTIELFDANGGTVDASDDWKDSTDQAEIQGRGLAPEDDRESAALTAVGPGNYTAVVRGKDGTTGVALVEIYNVR